MHQSGESSLKDTGSEGVGSSLQAAALLHPGCSATHNAHTFLTKMAHS